MSKPSSTLLRLWPGVLIVALMWLVRIGAPLVDPNGPLIALLGGLVGGLAVVLWWTLFSKAPGRERVGAVVLLFTIPAAILPFLHDSIRTGMMGLLYFVYCASPR